MCQAVRARTSWPTNIVLTNGPLVLSTAWALHSQPHLFDPFSHHFFLNEFAPQFPILFSRDLLATHLNFTREVAVSNLPFTMRLGQNVASGLPYFFIKRIFLWQNLIKSTLSPPSALDLTLKQQWGFEEL